MKKVLSIIAVIILFIASGLVFWAGLSPKTFSNFFVRYPEVAETVNQIGVLKNQAVDLSDITVSEKILGSKGQIIIKGNTWNVEIANNEANRVSGLSNRKTLYTKTGMLFAFDKMSKQSFWMKDMLIPIDMIFFDNNWKIVLIESNLQPNSFPKIFGGGVKSQYVLEVNALEAEISGLGVGDQAVFLNK
jgi:uncharacterized membrane protein (UPF0127 family)